MAATARPARRTGRRTFAAAGALLVATLVLTLDQFAAPQPAASADQAGAERVELGDAASSNAEPAAAAVSVAAAITETTKPQTRLTTTTALRSGWARKASGSTVAVAPTHYSTPIHPEAVTHPEADTMGSAVRAETAGAASARPLAESAAAPLAAASPHTRSAVPQLPGIDVSSHQGPIDWASTASHIDFAYAKATEGTYYRNPDFTNQYDGPYAHGVIRGAYHFAIPSNSSGTAQADYFIAHGGGWSPDGLTLPGALDIEYNPYGSPCYGLTQSQMTQWITNFITEYAAREHAYPVIYSTTNWWRTCTGNTGSFASFDPFWVANYGTGGAGPLPAGWGYYTFWQYSDSGSLPGDQDVFNGSYSRLKTLAVNG